MFTSDLLKALCDRDESPWSDMRGRPLDARGLAKRLKGYGIKSGTVRDDDATAKGYCAEDFADAFRRYLPCIGHKRHKGHNVDNKNNNVTDVTDVTDVREEWGKVCPSCAADGWIECGHALPPLTSAAAPPG
jgi:hypothetical protein